MRFLLSLSAISTASGGISLWLKAAGNLNSFSPPIVSFKYLVPICILSDCIHWVLQLLPNQAYEKLDSWIILAPPRLSYFLMLASIILTVIYPLCIMEMSKFSSTPQTNIIPLIYERLKTKKTPPIIFGLLTVYSTPILIVLISIVVGLTLLVGDSYTPSLGKLIIIR